MPVINGRYRVRTAEEVRRDEIRKTQRIERAGPLPRRAQLDREYDSETWERPIDGRPRELDFDN